MSKLERHIESVKAEILWKISVLKELGEEALSGGDGEEGAAFISSIQEIHSAVDPEEN